MENNYKHIVLQFDTAQKPKFEEKKGKGYVEFGAENDYPEYLLSLYNESPKHGAIVKGKSVWIYGKAFEEAGQANGSETWNEILRKCIVDDELYRGYYLQVIWNRLKQVSEIYHLEFHKVRVSKDLTKFYVKNDWKDFREKPRCYDAFNVNNPVGSQIFYYKDYNPSSEVYPYPSYFQALNMIESDIEVSRHILGNAKQGFSGSKLIQLNNGDPLQEEHKGEVERQLLKKFTGHDGKRVVITFNKSKEHSAEILDLGQSMLTKEDFTNVNNLIQQEIFAGHQITSPILFGIKESGQLGGRNEIRESYEIFNNTYINNRQLILEAIFTKFRNLKGEQGEFKIQPVDPLKFEFGESIMSQNLSKDEIREILGREPLENAIKTQAQIISDNINSLSPLVANKVLESMTPDEIRSLAGLTVAPKQLDVNGQPIAEAPAQMNEAIRNLSGRQYQNVMRIVRQFGNGKLTKEQASLMLKNGFNFTDDDVNTFLGIDNSPLTDDEIQKFSTNEDDRLIEEFGKVGESRDLFEILESKSAKEFDYFAEQKQLNQLEANILDLINKDKRITPEVLASTLRTDVKVINETLKGLIESKILKAIYTKVGADQITEREVMKPASELEGKKPKTQEILIRYSYEGPEDSRNRPFCAKLMELKRMYSRPEIELISERVGYSVWDRRGGWLTLKDGTHREYCRHRWQANKVTRK
jgi:DNA-binding Lrp family transcriptional regulator